MMTRALLLFLMLAGQATRAQQESRPAPMGQRGVTDRAIVSAIDDFGAKGDDSTDDTAALQSCINYAAAHRSTCYIPPAVYKITGAGLFITHSRTSLISLASMGHAQAMLRYYGTDTALTIGDGVNFIYAVNLVNIGIFAADGITAHRAIDCRTLSGGDWPGLLIGGTGTTGKFEVGIRFLDTGILNIWRPVISNRQGITGSVAMLFDEAGSHGGNYHIVIDGGDIYNQDTVYDFKFCIHCVIRDVWHEGYNQAINFDTIGLASRGIEIQNLVIEGNTFLSNLPESFHSRKVIRAKASANKYVSVDSFTFASNRVFNAGGITNPIVIDLAEGGASLFNLTIRDGEYMGTQDALIKADSPFTTIFIDGAPYVRTVPPKVEPALLAGTARLTMDRPLSVAARLDFAAAATVPGCTPNLTINVPRAAVGDSVSVGSSAGVGNQFVLSASVERADTVSLHWCQFSGAPQDPDGAGGTYRADVWKH